MRCRCHGAPRGCGRALTPLFVVVIAAFHRTEGDTLSLSLDALLLDSGGDVELARPDNSGVKITVDWLVGRVTQQPYAFD